MFEQLQFINIIVIVFCKFANAVSTTTQITSTTTEITSTTSEKPQGNYLFH